LPKDRSASIIDLGCGHGTLIYYIREAGYKNVIGVDISPEQVRAAASLGIEGISQGDLLEALRMNKDQSIDVVIAFDVIEHLTKAELVPFVTEVFRVLRPTGKFVLHTPNGESPFVGAIRYGDMTHELAFTRHSISQLLMCFGFSSIDCEESGPVPVGIKSSVRWGIWMMIRSALRIWAAAETGDTSRAAIYTRNIIAIASKQ
jgi:2-polyprenyl-3-methyl-5-hydroxy-6-metoxy-1,4-benzoquinol methylase